MTPKEKSEILKNIDEILIDLKKIRFLDEHNIDLAIKEIEQIKQEIEKL